MSNILAKDKLDRIIKESVNNLLKESFNDKRVSNEINAHGGLRKHYKKLSANMRADYDLQNCEYQGYLSPDTLKELHDSNMIFYLTKYLLYTNDGGAVVVDKKLKDYVNNIGTTWRNKVKQRNNKWGEETNQPNFIKDDSFEPYTYNTLNRRRERLRY